MYHEFRTVYDKIYALLKKSSDPDRAFLYFDDFLKNSHSRSTIFELLASFKVVGEILFELFSQSHSLSLFLINNPEYIFWLIEENTISSKKSKDIYLKEAKKFVFQASNFEKRELLIRHFRKKEYLRIAAKEVINACDFEETMEELSNLADALIEIALEMAFEKLKVTNMKNDLCVIGLGKLGNRELNFSSDIDLIFVHKTNQNSSIYNRVSSIIVNILNQNKEGGFVYRVDTRLRPGGSYSQLSMSIEEYENYYSTFGQLWEKLALLKARPTAGNIELGHKFIETVDPFVFKRSIDIEYIEEIRKLMFKIHKSSSSEDGLIKAEKRDVKKGKGCIREIEFILNYFQLLYGGKIKKLKKINTIKGLKELGKLNLLDKPETSFLIKAYLFLRRIEHKLQLENEQQTQLLPKDKESIRALAKKLSMELKEFLETYDSYTEKTHKIFKSIFIVDKGLPIFSTQDDLEGYLNEFNIKDVKTVASNTAEAVRKYKASKVKSSIIQKIFDFAFEFTRNTDKFDQVVSGLNKLNPVYISSISENKKLFEILLKFLAIGYADKFSKNPSLLDSIISPGKLAFEEISKKEKERIEFEIALKLLSGTYNHKDLKITTNFAKKYIKQIANEFDKKNGLNIIGYGKLATGELFVGSDLDIVFVSKDNPYIYEATARKIIKNLKELYEVDLRLRPFGDKGSLICDISYLKRYFSKDAQSWEKQAAQRSSIIYSSLNQKKMIESVIREFVLSKPPTKCEIFCMLKKIVENKGIKLDIKSSLGGITTIDFFVQAVGFEKKVIDISMGTLDILEKIKEKWTDQIENTYIFYFKILNVLRIAGLSSNSIEKNIKLVEFLIDQKNLKEILNKKLQETTSIVTEYFNGCTCK